MKRLLLVFSLFIAPEILVAAAPQMFPSGVFAKAESEWRKVSDYYASELRAMDEPSVMAHSLASKEKLFRFSWYRSLQGRWAVFRLQVESNGGGTLVMKLAMRGEGAELRVYRSATKTLSKDEVAALTRDFMMSSYVYLLPFVPMHGVDGSGWLLESSVDGYYQVVLRFSPQEETIHSIGRRFISQFADSDLKPIY